MPEAMAEPKMKKRPDEIIQEENRPAAVTVDQKTASRIAEHRRDRLDELEADCLGERNSTML
jgi:hypothetical protein